MIKVGEKYITNGYGELEVIEDVGGINFPFTSLKKICYNISIINNKFKRRNDNYG